MTDLGRMLIILGCVLVAVGVVLTIVGRSHLPLGRLPGDIVYRGKNTTVYFPLATSVLVSLVLSIVLYVVGRRLSSGVKIPTLSRRTREGWGTRFRFATTDLTSY